MPTNKHQRPLDSETFLRIRKRYLLAFAGIALTIIIAQMLIQRHLDSQLSDSRVINVAGRQRAYSQKLVKEAMILQKATTEEERQLLITELRQTLAIWEASHKGLQEGDEKLGLPAEDDPQILHGFHEIDSYHRAMVGAVTEILESASNENSIRPDDLQRSISTILKNERTFLTLMDGIVNQYDRRSKEKLQNLKQKEYMLLAFSLLILLLEILFIFRLFPYRFERPLII